MPKASLILRAKNEVRFIGETLDAIFAQQEKDFEVVLVDSGSTDGTLEVARRYPVHIVEIPSHEFSYGYALNVGIRESTGDFLGILSAHSLPANDRWLGAALAGFSDARVAAVFGRQLPRSNASSVDRLRIRISGVGGTTPKRFSRGMNYSNTNGAVRRSVWLRFPFDEVLPGAEDLAWGRTVYKAGYDIVYSPAMAVFHSHNEPWRSFVRRLWLDQPVIARIQLGLYGGEDRKAPAKKRGTSIERI